MLSIQGFYFVPCISVSALQRIWQNFISNCSDFIPTLRGQCGTKSGNVLGFFRVIFCFLTFNTQGFSVLHLKSWKATISRCVKFEECEKREREDFNSRDQSSAIMKPEQQVL